MKIIKIEVLKVDNHKIASFPVFNDVTECFSGYCCLNSHHVKSQGRDYDGYDALGYDISNTEDDNHLYSAYEIYVRIESI